MLAGCGDGDDNNAPDSTQAGGAQASGAKATRAVELIPDLVPLGFLADPSERDPAAVAGQDAHRALFQQQAGAKLGARVDATLHADVATATSQYATLSEALRKPPPDLFGGASTQADAEATGIGDQSKAYVTAQPDKDGNRVWTDVYRFGRSVVIVQVLGTSEPEALKARRSIAQLIAAKAP